MIYFVYTVHIIVCLFLIMVVLLQQGKGADLSVFGGGSTQTAFGARSAATLLHKLTVISFVLFIVITLSIAFLQGGRQRASVMSGLAEGVEEPAVPAPVTAPESLPGESGSANPAPEAPPTPAEAAPASATSEPPSTPE